MSDEEHDRRHRDEESLAEPITASESRGTPGGADSADVAATRLDLEAEDREQTGRLEDTRGTDTPPADESDSMAGDTLEIEPFDGATVLDLGMGAELKTPATGPSAIDADADADADAMYAGLSTRVDDELIATVRALQAAQESSRASDETDGADEDEGANRSAPVRDEDSSLEEARTTLDVRADANDASIDDLEGPADASVLAAETGPQGTALLKESDNLAVQAGPQGTALLEGSDNFAVSTGPQGTALLDESNSGDPALLPPAFPPNTTGDALEVEVASPVPSKPPAPPAAAQRPPTPEDGWAGYDDSGGWHTLSGESQVVVVEPEPLSARSSPPGPPVSGPMVFDSSASFESELQLVGVKGADTGRRHAIVGDEVLIGRSARCAIVLAEPSVSRQHARLERRGDGYWVVDLKSGNGTSVNGKRVNSSRVLHGDEVTFGNGVFQFVETEQPKAARSRPKPPPSEALSSPRKRRVNWPLAFILTTSLMVMVVGGVILALNVAASRRANALNRAFSRWNAGVEYFKARDWNQAERRFTDALELVPDHKRSLRYLDALRREREAQKLIAEAETALREKELKTAYRIALQVVGSLAYGERGTEVVTAVDQVVDSRLERARAALKAGRIDTVERELSGLDFIEPYRPEISRLRSALANRATPEAEAAKKRRSRR